MSFLIKNPQELLEFRLHGKHVLNKGGGGGGGQREATAEEKDLWATQAQGLKSMNALAFGDENTPGYLPTAMGNLGDLTNQAMDGTLAQTLRNQAGADIGVANATAFNDMQRVGGFDPSSRGGQDRMAQLGLGMARNRVGAMNQASMAAEDQKWQRNAAMAGLASGQGNSAVQGMGSLSSQMGASRQAANAADAQSSAGWGRAAMWAGDKLFAADGGYIDEQQLADGGEVGYGLGGWVSNLANAMVGGGGRPSNVGLARPTGRFQRINPTAMVNRQNAQRAAAASQVTAVQQAPVELPGGMAHGGYVQPEQHFSYGGQAFQRPTMPGRPNYGASAADNNGPDWKDNVANAAGGLAFAHNANSMMRTAKPFVQDAVGQAKFIADKALTDMGIRSATQAPAPLKIIDTAALVNTANDAKTAADTYSTFEAMNEAKTAADMANGAQGASGGTPYVSGGLDIAQGNYGRGVIALGADYFLPGSGAFVSTILPEFAEGGLTRKNMIPGGPVNGPGTETSDSIPARLSDGEYVLNSDAVKLIGKKKLDAWNKKGLQRRAAKGVKSPKIRGGYDEGGEVIGEVDGKPIYRRKYLDEPAPKQETRPAPAPKKEDDSWLKRTFGGGAVGRVAGQRDERLRQVGLGG